MVGTKHCCWGECKSDSRYPEKLPKSLQEMTASGQKAFIPFLKPSQGIDKCQRWITACSREFFTTASITRNTYICALHWPGEKGPTSDHPDPLKANFTSREIAKASTSKRKAPKVRPDCAHKQRKVEPEPTEEVEEIDAMSVSDVGVEAKVYLNPITGQVVSDKESQTEYTKHELAAKVDTMVLRNEVITKRNSKENTEVISSLSYEYTSQDSASMKHFVGLESEQFEALYNFINSVCPLDEIIYWTGKSKSGKGKGGRESMLSNREKLFISLVRLRRGFTIQTLASLLSTPERRIDESTIRKIFTTYIQLIYKIFRDMNEVMFPTRNVLQRYLPRVFKSMRNVRCIVDCTEFSVETSRNYSRQGNTYSSYKHTNTFKCLIAVTPNGGACFISDLYEGDIGDVAIFTECGILKHINPDDIVLADRGFTVQHLLNPLRAHLKIPAFLKGRGNLSAAEELETRKIAKARIHVERYNERLKQFRLIGRKIPLSLAPLATQMVVVAGGLVNFQKCLCK